MQVIKSTKLIWKKHSIKQTPKGGQIVFVATKHEHLDELSPLLLHEKTSEELGLSSKKLLLKPVMYLDEDIFTDLFEAEDLHWDWEWGEPDVFGEIQYPSNDLNSKATYFAELGFELNWEEMEERIRESRLEAEDKKGKSQDAVIQAIFLTKGLVPIVEWDSEQFVYS